MSNTPQDTDPKSWHKYFAIECNNRAWDLSTQRRTAAEDHELRLTAHAAAWHWSVVGEELHHMRATMLLAEACAALGEGPVAMHHADIMRDYFLARETPDWELAFVHAIHAHAAAALGDDTAHASSYAAAVAALEAIADEDDKAIVMETFEQVPAPASDQPPGTPG
jgi:hypothetical protein